MWNFPHFFFFLTGSLILFHFICIISVLKLEIYSLINNRLVMKNRGLSEDQVDEMTREAGVDKDDYVNYKKFIKVMEARYYIIRVALPV